MSSDITNLPIELIDLIFGHLTMANDRRRTAQVCKLFNRVIRSQSIRNRNNTLKLDRSPSGVSQKVSESPFRVFEDWGSLPFSKLIFGSTWTRNIVSESAFWTLHGHEISEITIYIGNNFNKEQSLLSLLNSYFPNLKKLSIEGRSTNDSDFGPKLQNTLNCPPPIEELCLSSLDSAEAIFTLLRSTPLKKLEIGTVEPKLLPKLFPWLESVEASCLYFYEMPLAKLINLPSKVVFGSLTIQVAEKPEMIREFFKCPRMIETLGLMRKDVNSDFNHNENEGANHPLFIYFTRDQVEALIGAKSIKEVKLFGVLDFGGSLDFLAQLPGLESISLFIRQQPNQLYPHYWSSPDTAKKIHEINHRIDLALDYLDGLSSLTSFSVFSPFPFPLSTLDENPHGLSGAEIQHLIRNCPNLKKLEIPRILANDADLIGTDDRLPFSSLEKLEDLAIFNAPNITSEALKSAFKFPNLKMLSVPYFSEKPFNQHDAKFLTQNCPNVESLIFRVSSINEEAFDYVIRNLPYLQIIHIDAKDTSLLIEEKVKELKKEFPYLDIIFRLPKN